MTNQEIPVAEKEDFKIFKNKQDAFASYVKAKKNFKTPTFNCTVKYSTTNFSYADLAEVLSCVEKPLLEEGLFIIHSITYEGDSEWITTYLQHCNGERIGFCKFPLDIKGKKMQEVGSQITYIKRYSLLSILSLAGEADDDGKELGNQPLNESVASKEQVIKMNAIKELFDNFGDVEKAILLKYFNVSGVEKIPVAKFDTAIIFLKKRLALVNGG